MIPSRYDFNHKKLAQVVIIKFKGAATVFYMAQ